MSTMQSKLLLVGTYCGLNKGDRLMQNVMIDGILQQLPDAGITLASPFPEIDKAFYPKARVVKSRRRNLLLSVLKLLLILLFPVKIRRQLAQYDAELRCFTEADVVVDLSGDMLTEDYGLHVAFSHSLPLLFSRLLGCRYYVVAQSIGPFRVFLPLYRWLLAGAAAVTVREPVSFDYLEEIGLENFVDSADLGFLLKADVPTPTDTGNSQSLCIGIAPSSLLTTKFTKGIPRDRIITDLAGLLDRVAADYDCQFVLIPHVMTPKGKGDHELCMQLSDRMASTNRVLSDALSPAAVKGEIGGLDALVAFRMHAAIAALGSEVPTIAVSYSHKTIGLFQQIGISDWIVINDSLLLVNLESKLRKLLKERDSISASIAGAVPELRRLAQQNIDMIVEGLKKSA